MANYGMVRNFAKLTPEQIGKMKEDLHLSMSEQGLTSLAGFYRAQRRDPYVAELRMLDALSAELESSPEAVGINGLLTDDAYCAETFADLMKKRRELFPERAHPCMLAEIPELTDRYLTLAGAGRGEHSAAFRTIGIADGERHGLTGTQGILSSPVRFAPGADCREAPQKDDYLILLASAPGQSDRQFEAALSDYFASKEAKIIKKRIFLSDSLLLRELLRHFSGLRLDWTRLSAVSGTGASPLSLTFSYAGAALVTVPKEDYRSVLERAEESGWRASLFAAVTDSPDYLFSGDNISFRIPFAFLTRLFLYKSVQAKLPTEQKDFFPTVAHTVASPSVCRYLCGTEQAETETFSIGEELFAGAVADGETDLFRKSMLALLVPMLTLSAAGISRKEMVLDAWARFGNPEADGKKLGEITQTLLGFSRAQSETAVRGKIRIPDLSGARAPSLTVSLSGKKPAEKIRNRFVAEENHVYCFAPRMRDDGIPDFPSLRNLLDQLAEWAKDGKIAASSVVCGESVTDVLRRMEPGNGLYCHIVNERIIVGDTLPLGVIVESDAALPGVPIGSVKRRSAPDGNAIPDVTSHSLIWSEVPEVTVCGCPEDSHAELLAAHLCASGAVARVFNDPEGQAGELSRSLLLSQYLILCGDVCLPETREIAFADKTFDLSGGIRIRVGGTGNVVSEREILLPDGLSLPVLEQILKKTE